MIINMGAPNRQIHVSCMWPQGAGPKREKKTILTLRLKTILKSRALEHARDHITHNLTPSHFFTLPHKKFRK